ncbi:MAG: sugar transferase, partial [Rhodoferax sp.]|nr:sugar transferase [Rhodoferax sp.]
MIKIFNHYIHKRTVLQLLLDFGLILGTVLLATGWHMPDLVRAASAALPSAVLLAIAALTINAALGFYQRVHNRSVAQSRARAMLSLCLILPLAYLILRVLPLGLEDQDFVSLSVV